MSINMCIICIYKYMYVYTVYVYLHTHTVYYISYSLDLPSHTHPEFLQLCWDVMYHWQLNQKHPCTESPCGIDCLSFIRIHLLRFYRYWPEG